MRVTLLTNFVPPYRLPVYQELATRVRELKLLVTCKSEPNRKWPVKWENLDIKMLRSVVVSRVYAHGLGFRETGFLHIPLTLLPELLWLNPDLVISGELGLRSIQAAIYCAVTGKRLILWVAGTHHSDSCRGWVRRMARKWVLGRADAILAYSRAAGKHACSMGAVPSKVTVQPLPVDNAFFRSDSYRDDEARYRFLYSGRLVPLKGLREFIGALAAEANDRPNQHIEMWFAGDGPERASLERIPHPSNLRLSFFGEVPYERMPWFYAQCGIFAMPSQSDVWGLVVNEAMAAGLPVLGSHYAEAINDLVEDGANGWTFRGGDVESARGAIRRVLDTPSEKLQEMGSRARGTIEPITPAALAEVLAVLCRTC